MVENLLCQMNNKVQIISYKQKCHTIRTRHVFAKENKHQYDYHFCVKCCKLALDCTIKWWPRKSTEDIHRTFLWKLQYPEIRNKSACVSPATLTLAEKTVLREKSIELVYDFAIIMCLCTVFISLSMNQQCLIIDQLAISENLEFVAILHRKIHFSFYYSKMFLNNKNKKVSRVDTYARYLNTSPDVIRRKNEIGVRTTRGQRQKRYFVYI